MRNRTSSASLRAGTFQAPARSSMTFAEKPPFPRRGAQWAPAPNSVKRRFPALESMARGIVSYVAAANGVERTALAQAQPATG